MSDNNHKTVLMADDDEDDCVLAIEAFRESGAKASLSCVRDGMELMEYLSLHSGSETKTLPALILLDLNMPRKNGRTALTEMKSQPALNHIPIVVLTTSGEPKDITFTIQAGADSFITKPATLDAWVEMIKSLAERWL